MLFRSSYGWSVIQALLSRSDRRLAPVIAAARGSHESLGGWKQAYRQALNAGSAAGTEAAVSALRDTAPPPPPWEEVIHASWSPDQALPWGHLQGALPTTTLARHQREALT